MMIENMRARTFSQCILALIALTLSTTAIGEATDCSKASSELVNMVKVDQKAREDLMKIAANPNLSFDSAEARAVIEKLTKIDTANTSRLQEILEACNWPVDKDSARNAWLLAQHADTNLPFQKSVLSQMKIAMQTGHADAKDFAYLTDRIASAEGRPQLYGTQFTSPTPCTLAMKPVDDMHAVILRRQAAGMGSLDEYAALAEQMLTENGCQNATVQIVK